MNTKIKKFAQDHATAVKITLGIAAAAAIYTGAVVKTAHGFRWVSTDAAIWSAENPDVIAVTVKFANGTSQIIPTSLPA